MKKQSLALKKKKRKGQSSGKSENRNLRSKFSSKNSNRTNEIEAILKIESLSSEGAGVGRLDSKSTNDNDSQGEKSEIQGKVVFVENTAPGDLVRVRLTKNKKSFALGEILEIIEPGRSRVTPPCPVAAKCGGCQWQHVEYNEQLRQKKKNIESALIKIAKLPEIPDFTVEPSPRELRYRNRIQLHVKDGECGFFAPSSHDLISIEDCLITEEELTEKFSEILDHYPTGNHRFEIRRRQDGVVDCRKTNDKKSSSESNGVGETNRIEDRDESVNEIGFAQVNESQNKNLVKYVVEKAKEIATRPTFQSHAPPVPREASLEIDGIFDFYCGAGNFTFPVAEAVEDLNVVGVEFDNHSVKTAKKLAKDLASKNDENSCANRISFHKGKTEDFLTQKAFKESSKSIFILDPPRSGCHASVIDWFVENSEKVAGLIYVSCHTATLARDLRKLAGKVEENQESTLRSVPKSNPKFRISGLAAFDMFPQTSHVETVAVLSPKPVSNSLW